MKRLFALARATQIAEIKWLLFEIGAAPVSRRAEGD
jgi:hypothetical protein